MEAINVPVPVITYGTRNPVKMVYMKETLRGIPLLLRDLSDPACTVTDGHRMNAEEMIAHYAALATKYGGRLCRPVQTDASHPARALSMRICGG